MPWASALSGEALASSDRLVANGEITSLSFGESRFDGGVFKIPDAFRRVAADLRVLSGENVLSPLTTAHAPRGERSSPAARLFDCMNWPRALCSTSFTLRGDFGDFSIQML